MNAKLVAINDRKVGEEIPIFAPMLRIGRGDDCDLQPPSKLIGRLHCVVSLDEDAVVIEDCGGAVGTFVNGVKLDHLRHELKNGDRINIDKSEYEVQIAAGEAEENKRLVHNVNLWDATVRSFSSTAVGKSEDDNAKSTAQSRMEREAHLHREAVGWSGIDLLLLAAIGILAVVMVSFMLPEDWGAFSTHSMGWYWKRFLWHLNQWWEAGWLGWAVLTVVVVGWTLFLSLRAWRQRRGKT
jgi:hypothetical protein